MANFLNRFSKSPKGVNSGGIKDYVSRISPSGDFKEIRDIEVILNSWTNILMIPRGTYLDDPSFGSELYKYVMEPADELTVERISDEIFYSLQSFDDRAVIQDITVNFMANRKGFQIIIDIEYLGDKHNLKLLIDERTYFNILRTE